jgi:hypothetical protein
MDGDALALFMNEDDPDPNKKKILALISWWDRIFEIITFSGSGVNPFVNGCSFKVKPIQYIERKKQLTHTHSSEASQPTDPPQKTWRLALHSTVKTKIKTIL